MNIDFFNDVWASKDAGSTWIVQTNSAPWSRRKGLEAAALGSTSFVMTGGYAGLYSSDVWLTHDIGVSWIQLTSAAPFNARSNHALLSLSSTQVILLAGYNGYAQNDVWSSSDSGSTWQQLISSGFPPRFSFGVTSGNGYPITVMGGSKGGDLMIIMLL